MVVVFPTIICLCYSLFVSGRVSFLLAFTILRKLELSCRWLAFFGCWGEGRGWFLWFVSNVVIILVSSQIFCYEPNNVHQCRIVLRQVKWALELQLIANDNGGDDGGSATYSLWKTWMELSSSSPPHHPWLSSFSFRFNVFIMPAQIAVALLFYGISHFRLQSECISLWLDNSILKWCDRRRRRRHFHSISESRFKPYYTKTFRMKTIAYLMHFLVCQEHVTIFSHYMS